MCDSVCECARGVRACGGMGGGAVWSLLLVRVCVVFVRVGCAHVHVRVHVRVMVVCVFKN